MKHTLLLNAGFEPLRIVSWQRAFILVFQEKVEILEEYAAYVSTVTQSYKIPAVIKLRRWVNHRNRPPVIRFSRANLYARDDYRCQYCYRKFGDRELTLDHVIPVVRGGKKTWDNIVSACIRCNQRKGHFTPEEKGFKLLRRPHAPRWLPGVVGPVRAQSAPEVWLPYLSFVWNSARTSN